MTLGDAAAAWVLLADRLAVSREVRIVAISSRSSIAHLSLLRQPGDLAVPNASHCPPVHGRGRPDGLKASATPVIQ